MPLLLHLRSHSLAESTVPCGRLVQMPVLVSLWNIRRSFSGANSLASNMQAGLAQPTINICSINSLWHIQLMWRSLIERRAQTVQWKYCTLKPPYGKHTSVSAVKETLFAPYRERPGSGSVSQKQLWMPNT
ncbi:hypothetical protein O988_03036 [Pseudogymnoascus sp. VKM F-3808]|nr:hypothetical protein O988_03036 [Pseudogymnoascus sp. VKM F-3808]